MSTAVKPLTAFGSKKSTPTICKHCSIIINLQTNTSVDKTFSVLIKCSISSSSSSFISSPTIISDEVFSKATKDNIFLSKSNMSASKTSLERLKISMLRVALCRDSCNTFDRLNISILRAALCMDSCNAFDRLNISILRAALCMDSCNAFDRLNISMLRAALCMDSSV